MENEKSFGLEIFNETIEMSLEDDLAKALIQVSSFVDQMTIEMTKEDIDKTEFSKNLSSLRSFVDQILFQYKVKSFLKEKENAKKKELELKKEEMKQEGQLEQDQQA